MRNPPAGGGVLGPGQAGIGAGAGQDGRVLTVAQFGIEGVAKRVAKEAESEDGQRDG